MPPVRCTSWSRIPGRPEADRVAVLHQFGRPGIHQDGIEVKGGYAAMRTPLFLLAGPDDLRQATVNSGPLLVAIYLASWLIWNLRLDQFRQKGERLLPS